jgi:lipopolysaccharide heptosyltransferase II
VPNNILIVRFSSIGDILLTTPLVRAIRERHPDSRITFVVREDMADTIRHNKRIDEVVTWRRGSSLGDLAWQLREQEWTHRLDLHCSLRSYRLRRMIGGRWRGYSKHRFRRKMIIMSHGSMGGALAPVAERYFAAARDLDVTPDGGPPEFFSSPEGEARAAAILAQHQLGVDRPFIALAPGAAHFTKRWPEYHWIDMVQKIGADRDFIVLGGKAEETMAATIADAAKGSGRAVSIAGRVSHDVNGALLRRAELLISGDTGLLHLASAVGTRVVGIYGPTVEAFGFFPYQADFTAVQHDLPCRPCSTQGGPKCPKGHHNCLVGITADEVIAAMDPAPVSSGE